MRRGKSIAGELLKIGYGLVAAVLIMTVVKCQVKKYADGVSKRAEERAEQFKNSEDQ